MTQRRDRDDGRDQRRVDRPAHRHPRAPDRGRRRLVGLARRRGGPRARWPAPASMRAELDLIVTATASPDYYFPATASLIGERIGAGEVAGYDLSAACTGFIYALAQAYSQIAAGLAETVLVVGTEVFSRLLDWSDRSTCILFGDGAGAVVLRRDDRPPRAARLRAGRRRVGRAAAVGRSGRPRRRPRRGPVRPDERAARSTSSRRGWWSTRPCAAWRRPASASRTSTCSCRTRRTGASSTTPRAGWDWTKPRCSPTSTDTATPPQDRSRSAWTRRWRQGRIGPGDVVLMVGFGGGLAWGSCVMEWTKERA